MTLSRDQWARANPAVAWVRRGAGGPDAPAWLLPIEFAFLFLANFSSRFLMMTNSDVSPMPPDPHIPMYIIDPRHRRGLELRQGFLFNHKGDSVAEKAKQRQAHFGWNSGTERRWQDGYERVFFYSCSDCLRLIDHTTSHALKHDIPDFEPATSIHNTPYYPS